MDKHKLLAEFLEIWSLDRLRNMSIEEYTNLNKNDSFCYWLEQRTNELGGITGGSSFKFGIYKRNNTEKEISTSNGLTDGEYAWFEKYGQTRVEAFQKVRNIIVQIAEFATNKEFDKIEEIDLGESTKWKIAFMYSDFQLINTFSKDMVCSILDFLQIEYSYDESRFSLSNKILSQKNEDEDYFDFGSKFWNETLISQGLKKILTKLGERVLPYFDIMDRIVENFNLEPNNEKYYFSYNSKELIFTIGQRYIWNLTKNEYKYISLTKNEEIAETFGRENQDPDAFLNYSKNPENFSTIFDRISLSIKNELEGTIKASHRNQNKKDLQELVFNKEFRSKILYNKRRLFIQWLSKQFEEKNGTNNSYVRAIDILSELLKIDLFTISEIEFFRNLYEDLILNQKDELGKYYYEKAISYGRDGFYSAAIQMYINFLSSDKNQLNEPIPAYTMNTKTSLNQILYGPPGTGKTYNTINKAVQIANSGFIVDDSLNANEKRKLIKDEYLRLVDVGQIVFTTFHQSMTYEDFIEGIKPVIEENEDGAKSVVYEVKNGIFKEICKNAEQPQFEKLAVVKDYSFDDAFNDLVLEANQKLENNEQLFLPILTENLGLKIVGISDRGNLILKPIYSDDAKEYTVSYSRAEKLQQAYPDLSVVKNIDKEFRAVIGGSNSTAYWSVLNYINNKINLEKKSISQSVSLPLKPYVLIIDEINRGNVSQIFGELITLIEEDKRLGNDEAIEVTLPYSKDKFGVPSNLYIIGTMNTADRSVEALDSALRRRFVFEEIPPKYDLVGLQQELFGFKTADILETINQRIEKLLDRDHQIGHAYFINKNESTFIDSFYKNIIPLLQEYFFGDYGKIGLVLGAGFIRKMEQDSVFANFEHLDYSQFEEKESYEIINHRNSFEGFKEAIQLLMNR